VVIRTDDVHLEEARPWRWGSWLSDFYSGRESPPEFGNALLTVLYTIKGRYPDTFHGQSELDIVQDVLLMTVEAITRSKALRRKYLDWNDRQLYGYVRTIIENNIRVQRKQNHPQWFLMLKRIRKLARTRLKLVDKGERTYIPVDWVSCESNWETDEGLESRLLMVPVFEEKVPPKIPGKLIEKAIRKLYEAAACPIPLRTLAMQCFRLLRIHETSIEFADNSILLEIYDSARDSLETEISLNPNPNRTSLAVILSRSGREIREWLMELLRPLSPREHLVPIYFRTCKEMTLHQTARNSRKILGLHKLAPETVRNRLAEAAKLMRDEGKRERWFPKSAEEREALNSLFAECIKTKLVASGIHIENACDSY
jgi:hypothetical protein